MNIKQIEYLDLEIQSCSRYIRYFQSDSQQHLTHDLHGDQPMLNTLVDLIIILGSKLELIDKANNQILVNIKDRLVKIENLLIEKLDNIEYIKIQNNDIYIYIYIYARIKEFRSLDLKPKYNINQQKILDQIGERIDPLQELLKEIKQIILS